MSRIAAAAVAAALVVVGFLPIAARADDPVTEAAEHLKPLAFLVGTWLGSGETEGMKYADEYTIAWGLNRSYLKQTYVMKAQGKVVWTDEGTIAWDPEKKKIVGFNFGMDGSIGRGTEVETKAKDTLVMEGYVVGSPHFKFYRTTLARVDDDHMTITTEMRKEEGAKYELYGTQKYERKKEKKED